MVGIAGPGDTQLIYFVPRNNIVQQAEILIENGMMEPEGNYSI